MAEHAAVDVDRDEVEVARVPAQAVAVIAAHGKREVGVVGIVPADARDAVGQAHELRVVRVAIVGGFGQERRQEPGDVPISRRGGLFVAVERSFFDGLAQFRDILGKPGPGRVHRLLRLFPDAKFIHIVRNPYAVYRSTKHMYRTLLPLFQLDDVEPEELTRTIIDSYAMMMRQYMKDRDSIPHGHLAEVRYEDLERDPMAELERVYAELALPGWAQALDPIADYLHSLSGYRKNPHQFDQETIDRVDREWGFAVKAWGYRPPK